MTAGYLVHHSSSVQEIIAVFDKDETLIDVFVQRQNALNLGEIIDAKITLFNKTLRGYFALTSKNLSVFIPTKENYSQGETVRVKINKEARLGKDATGQITDMPVSLPNLKDVVKEKYPFDFKNNLMISECIEEALENDVLFADGAVLSIERTNAVWTIDIDSAKSTLSLLEINLKAIPVIKKQIKLKNIAGMILIDFAGYKRENEKSLLIKELKNSFKNDDRTKIYGFSKMNLLEMKRARTFSSLLDLCYTKEGLKTPDYVNLCISEKLSTWRKGKPALEMNPAYVQFLSDEIKNNVVIKSNLNVQVDFFELKEK